MCSRRFVPLLICLSVLMACSPEKKREDIAYQVFYDSLLSDSIPVKLMPDTLLVTPEKPLIIRDRASSDSVNIFPYTLIFENPEFDTYVVSFTDFSPTLITLDKEKLVIDSIMLIGKHLPATGNYRHRTSVIISRPDHIRVCDSIFTWSTDAAHKRSQQVRASEKVYAIGKDGIISSY